MNDYSAKSIITFLDEYCEYYKKLILFLHKKHNKILNDDLNWMLDSLTEEQALVMTGSSLEQKRLQLFKALGVDGYKAKMLVDESPDDMKTKMEISCSNIASLVNEVRRINTNTTEIVEKKLSGQQNFVKQAGILKRPQTYNVAGNKVSSRTETTIIGDF